MAEDKFPPVIQHFNEAQKTPWWYSGAATLAAGAWLFLAAILLLVILEIATPSLYVGAGATGAMITALIASSIAYGGSRK